MKSPNEGIKRISELWGSTDDIKEMLRRYGVARVYYPVDDTWVSHISKETGCYYKYDDENRTLWFATKEMALKGVDILDKKPRDDLIDLNLLAARAAEMSNGQIPDHKTQAAIALRAAAQRSYEIAKLRINGQIPKVKRKGHAT